MLGGLGGLTVLSWTYVATAMGGPGLHHGLQLGYLLSMWVVMMAGMMLPSAAPMVVSFNRLTRGHGGGPERTAVFVAGYLVVWVAVSAAGGALEWELRRAALVSAGGVLGAPVLAGAVLLAAGAYQLAPLKNACLRRCRTPLAFLMTEWRPGSRGALSMGLRHGVECVGCCWGIMALLFVVGVMGLLWMAGLTLLVLVEKTVPGGDRVGRLAGIALIGWGAWTIVAATV